MYPIHTWKAEQYGLCDGLLLIALLKGSSAVIIISDGALLKKSLYQHLFLKVVPMWYPDDMKGHFVKRQTECRWIQFLSGHKSTVCCLSFARGTEILVMHRGAR